MALAGRKAQVKISGAAVAGVLETTSSDNTTYTIASYTNRCFDRTHTIYVCVFGASDTAEAGTNTTNIKMTGHGLITGDVIKNDTRAGALRSVTKVDDDNITVAAVSGQTDGDTIFKYNQAADGDTTKDRLAGSVTFGSSSARTVVFNCYYLVLTAAADANQYGYTLAADNADNTKFGAAHTYRTKAQCLKDISGNITSWGSIDTTFHDALIAGEPVVIEFWSDSSDTYDVRCWALLNSKAMSAACDGVLDEVVDFEGSQDADGNVVAFN